MTKKKKDDAKENPIFKQFNIEISQIKQVIDNYYKSTPRPKPPIPSRDDYEREIAENAKEYRAYVIELTIQLESFFDEVLSLYFCEINKQDDFLKMCLQQEYFTLKKKIELSIEIAKKILGDETLRTEFGKDYKSILFKIAEQRNKVAHVHFNPKLFKMGDTTFFGDKLHERGINKISIKEATIHLIFGMKFTLRLIEQISALNLKKRGN